MKENDQQDTPELLTVEEVAEVLRLKHPKKVYGLGIPAIKLSERRTRWFKRDVLEYINSRPKA